MISSVRVIVSTRQRLERGSERAAPLARVDGLEPLMLAFPASGRQAIFLGATGPRAARPGKETPPRSDASRPRPVGGVNWLVKTLTLTREITGGMLRAARARRPLD